VTRRFGGVTAVNGVNLTVTRGQVSAVIGPNGAGKTTLFNMIAGTLKPTSGDIVFEGQRINGLSEYEIVKRGIARTFQNTRLFPNMSVRDNVLAGASPHMRADAVSIILGAPWARREERQAQEDVDELLAFVRISHLATRAAREISYGDGRRVAIARALATRPRLLLLDEPAAGMNNAETEELVHLVERLSGRGVTTLLIEHDMSLVMRVCQAITVLDHGECIAMGTPAEIQQNQRVVEAYLGSGTVRTARRQLRLRADTGC
jgi:branched-chain amino acid transport system ATP-binding protein